MTANTELLSSLSFDHDSYIPLITNDDNLVIGFSNGGSKGSRLKAAAAEDPSILDQISGEKVDEDGETRRYWLKSVVQEFKFWYWETEEMRAEWSNRGGYSKYSLINGELVLTDSNNTYRKNSAWITQRLRRNELLQETDWAVAPDSPLTAEKRAEWEAYRQALRDVPQNNDNPYDEDIVWPDKPL